MMNASTENDKFVQVVHKMDPQSKLLRAWALKGGVSAQMTALEIEQANGYIQRMIVRQHSERFLNYHPQITVEEFKLLQLLHAAKLAVSRPYHLDLSGTIFAAPYMVIEYIEGETEFAPSDLLDFLRQFAMHLSYIHQMNSTRLDLSFLPEITERSAEKLREQLSSGEETERRLRDTLRAAWPLPPQNTAVLLHGDFWPGNVLWKDGQIVAIIDWEDAALGDPLADIANSRLELLWAFGSDAMRHFTHLYQSMTTINFAQLPYWDLWAALRRIDQIGLWGLDAATEKSMCEKLQYFIIDALDKI